MFKNLEDAKIYMPPEIYEFIKYLDYKTFDITRLDNNKDVWNIVKNEFGIKILYKGKSIKKLNWYERLKVMLNV